MLSQLAGSMSHRDRCVRHPVAHSGALAWMIGTLLSLEVAWGASASMSAQTAEQQVVAAVLMGEAWCQGSTGMMAVGEVIHQRCVKQGKTPMQVVTAGRSGVHAFSCLNRTSPEALIRKFREVPDFQIALEVARMVCCAPQQLPGITRQATHYSRAVEKPWWARGSKPVAIVGDHAFYRLGRI
jgi:N-acetylmuramoyl-L-alanine amidase